MLTLKKVKELVGAPSHAKRTPSPKMLYEEGIVLLRREFDQGSHLTVYNSGYVLFSAGKRNTVFHIHDCCGDYAYDAAEGKGDVIEEEYFENCEWHEDILVTVCCQGWNFTAKYKDVLQPGYTAKPVPLVEPEKNKNASFPNDLEQGMVIPTVRAEKKQGFTSPPKVYTEDTLLSAMETAGNKEFEKDTEKKGLGTPATRAAILEKLVSSGYVERKGKQMIPTEDGVAAIRNIPGYLKSASMTAEWENDLLRMERGEIKPHDFMQGIHGLLDKMLADLRQIPTVAAAPHHNKVSVGKCPVCGNPVHESKLSFCCADRNCKFALWKESRYLSNMRKTLDKKMAVDLLKKGRTHVKDFYSAKKDKTFAADLVMRVEEGRAQYSLEFPKTPMQTKT